MVHSELAAVERTMQILELLASYPDGLGVTELADRLDLPKATVSRILSTLESGRYVTQDPRTNLFSLTWRLVGLAYRFADAMPLEELAKPVLRDLAAKTQELVQFAVVQRDEMIFIAKVEGAKSLRVASMLGMRAPLHATAVGKVWLASLPQADVLRILGKQGMRPITDKTITDLSVFLAELQQVREQGYALVREEVNPSVVALAVPLPIDGRPVQAGLVVAIPVYEASAERLEELRVACVEAAKELGGRLPPSSR